MPWQLLLVGLNSLSKHISSLVIILDYTYSMNNQITCVFLLTDVKTFKFMWTIGFILCVSGEILRKVSMITANTNFSHVVQFEHNHGHVLVTNGVYSYM